MKTGCYTAMITPFADDRVDFDGFNKLIDFQIANGNNPRFLSIVLHDFQSYLFLNSLYLSIDNPQHIVDRHDDRQKHHQPKANQIDQIGLLGA